MNKEIQDWVFENQYTTEQLAVMAKKYCEMEDKMAEFFSEESESDLTDIGDYFVNKFGYG